MPEVGVHNLNMDVSRARLIRGQTFRDLSTVCLIPIPQEVAEPDGTTTTSLRITGVPARVLQSWFSLLTPMNQKFVRVFLSGMEVGDAYTAGVQQILVNPELSTWRYLLTLEWDNLPPPDGLLQLYESITGGVDGTKYDAVGGLYWTKGPGGQPMIYGDPTVLPRNFMPQVPKDGIHPCNGLGMGFTLFRLAMFKDVRLRQPWFETVQRWVPGKGIVAGTQDLHFFEDAAGHGYKFACDTRVRVGHYDPANDIVW